MCLIRPSKDIPVFPDIPDIPVFPVFPDIPVVPDTPETFRTFQSFMTFQPFQAILQVPVPPGFPPHYSILQLECIFYIFYKFYSSIGFHRKLHQVPVEQNTNILQTLHSSKKGRCCDISQNWQILQNRIISSNVLSSRVANYKNDIQ